MRPINILLGICVRALASIFLISYLNISIATLLIPSVSTGAIISTLLSLVAAAVIISAIVGFRPDNRARYALASIFANASMALCLAGHLIFSFQITALYAAGVLLAFWHGHMTRIRYRQLRNGAYLCRFEPKPKLPSPWAVLSQARANRRA